MTTPIPRKYFVDESGDGVLFGSRGANLPAQVDRPLYFILGAVHVEDPKSLREEFHALKRDIMGDPYFQRVPSISKTTTAFHAKDDVPEVRREVFRLLYKHTFTFDAVLFEMVRARGFVLEQMAINPDYRYTPNHLYDRAVDLLFTPHFSHPNRLEITFSKRSISPRNQALTSALERARKRYADERPGVAKPASVRIDHGAPDTDPCLQAVDYCMWAIQRAYNSKKESRYLEYLSSKIGFIVEGDFAPK